MITCSHCQKSNPQDMRFCGYCGQPALAGREVNERRMVTVLFSDLVGFTAFSTDHTADEIPLVLNTYQNFVTEEVTRAGGLVAQYLGDGVMIYFGYPDSIEDAPLRAVQSAIRIVNNIKQLNLSGDFPLAVRMGIHHGSGIMSQIGQRDHLLLGDVPNIAARLQQIAEPNSIVLSDVVNTQVRDDFETYSLGNKIIKGVAQDFPTFGVRTRTQVQSRFERSLAKGLSTFIGRETELRQLADCQRALQSVVVKGEPGVGKSRLIHEHKRISGGEWLVTRCSDATRRSPYFTITDLLAEQLGDNPLGDNAAVAYGDRLAKLLGTESAQLQPNEVAQRCRTLLAGDRHIHIEDVHWIDQQSLEVIEQLVTDNSPVHFLLTARPEFTHRWPHEIHLEPLDQQETDRLVSGIVPLSNATPEVTRFIASKTQGNPLFVEELVHMLSDEAVLGGDATALNRMDEKLPDSLADLLNARLDRLGEARFALQQAAVIGIEFETSLLQQVYEGDARDLPAHLELLKDTGLLIEQGETLQIKHGLVRDAAYNALYAPQRQRIHRRIARNYEDNLAQVPLEIIARHWLAGGEQRISAEYYLNAGHSMIERALHQPASVLAEKALGVSDELPDSRARDDLQRKLLMLLGNCIRSLEGYASDNMLKVYEPATALTLKLNAGPELLPIMYGRWTYYLARGSKQTPLSAMDLEQYARQSLSEHDPRVKLTVSFVKGTTSFFEGRLRDARLLLEEAVALYEQSDHTSYMREYGEDLGLYASVWLQWVYVHMGEISLAREQVRQSLAIADAIDDPLAILLAKTFAMHVAHELEEFDQAITIADDIVAFCDAQPYPYYLAIARGIKGRCQQLLTAAQSVGSEDRRASIEYIDGIAHSLLYVARIRDDITTLLINKDFEVCSKLMNQAFQVLGAQFDNHYLADIHGLSGVLAANTDDPQSAESSLRKAVNIAHVNQAGYFEVKNALRLAEFLATRHRTDDAIALLRPPVHQHCRKGDCVVYAKARDFLNTLTRQTAT